MQKQGSVAGEPERVVSGKLVASVYERSQARTLGGHFPEFPGEGSPTDISWAHSLYTFLSSGFFLSVKRFCPLKGFFFSIETPFRYVFHAVCLIFHLSWFHSKFFPHLNNFHVLCATRNLIFSPFPRLSSSFLSSLPGHTLRRTPSGFPWHFSIECLSEAEMHGGLTRAGLRSQPAVNKKQQLRKILLFYFADSGDVLPGKGISSFYVRASEPGRRTCRSTLFFQNNRPRPFPVSPRAVQNLASKRRPSDSELCFARSTTFPYSVLFRLGHFALSIIAGVSYFPIIDLHFSIGWHLSFRRELYTRTWRLCETFSTASTTQAGRGFSGWKFGSARTRSPPPSPDSKNHRNRQSVLTCRIIIRCSKHC